MIDPHVHCRDWEESHKETVAHALHVAERAGVSAIFDMPNTKPAIVSYEIVKRRLEHAKSAQSKTFYGVYIGLTYNPKQIEEAVRTFGEFSPSVVGFKMYAGHSVGNLAMPNEEDQKRTYKILEELGYKGVLAVHCENEKFMKPELWNPQDPISHTKVRSPEVEINSVRDQIAFASESNFSGTLHIAHISHPDSVNLVIQARKDTSLKITCGVTPHHCLLSSDLSNNSDGLLYKVNPPLRTQESADAMLEHLRLGAIDFVETDHAPHTLFEKMNAPYLSGFPGLPFLPFFAQFLELQGFTEQHIRKCMHERACEIFQIDIPNLALSTDYDLAKEYEVDVYAEVRKRIREAF